MSGTRYKNVCILRVILGRVRVPVWEFCLQRSCWDCSAKSIQASGHACPSQELWLLGSLFVAGKAEKFTQEQQDQNSLLTFCWRRRKGFDPVL